MRPTLLASLRLRFVLVGCFAAACWAWTPLAADFADDFERPDAPVDGWTALRGTWNIASGRLVIANGAAGGENWLWAGSPPITGTQDFTASLKVSFDVPSTQNTLRHGGIMICASEPTERFAMTMDGYTLDFLELNGNFRLIRWDNGGVVVLTETNIAATGLAGPDGVWAVAVAGDHIAFSVEGVPVIDFDDATYRSGHFGLWAFGANEQMSFDDVVLDFADFSACFTNDVESGPIPLAVNFDAGCSIGGAEFTWDFGDGDSGAGQTVSHIYTIKDTYTVTLTVKDAVGATKTAQAVITAIELIGQFDDEFARADGPLDGWTTVLGEWTILGEQAHSAGADAWTYAGDPAIAFAADIDASFTLSFPVIPGGDVGRHGGVMFAASAPAVRQTAGLTGYTLDWLDRTMDRGYRLIRWNGVAFAVIGTANPTGEPGAEWRIVMRGEIINVYADGALVIQARDATYRTGHFGFWTFGNGSEMLVDNFRIGSPTEPLLAACFSIAPGPLVPIGTDQLFDAGCTVATDAQIDGYAWDFGDGQSANGATVEHKFAAPGAYPVKLTVSGNLGSITSEATTTAVAIELLESFADDFERDDGPVGDQWTVAQGDWSILDGRLTSTSTSAAAADEPWIWVGDGTTGFAGDFRASVLVNFVRGADEPNVRAHGGLMFHASRQTLRWGVGMNGYTIDFLEGNGNFRLIRWDSGAFAVVQETNIGATGLIEPNGEWLVEVSGDKILLSVEGVPVLDATDATYRLGYFGLWNYGTNGQIAFDDLQIGKKPVDEFRLLRGDCNGDGGTTGVGDAIFMLTVNFIGGVEAPCKAACDVSGDGSTVGVGDAILLLTNNFIGGVAIPPPFPACAASDRPTDRTLGCTTPSRACP